MDKYQKPITISRQSDFFEKWAVWKSEVKALPKDIESISETDTDYGYTKEFYFTGVANTKVYGCLFLNKTKDAKKELIVLYHGLGAVIATEGYQQIAKYWLDEGYSVLGMDSRLQGGKTIDPNHYQYREYGLTAFNILDPDNYYSKRLFQDALQLLEITESLPEIKSWPIYVTGGSKGGELSLFSASLSKKVSLCLCDIPSGCYLEGRIKGAHGSYRELNKFIADHPEREEQVLKTVSYFDLANFASQIACPVLASVGSEDLICPPDFFYQAYRQIPSPKVFIEYAGYGHGGYDSIHMAKKFVFIEIYRVKE
ncbi:MAG: acetylxylan esterase [Bacilli bacterium]|jgi:cephalosporin-C deacetylase|nr:acetylxylan esterase [Bacilli bacterium]HHU23712.1 acetylxylan esterase [Acholeplasmataceae bacterium]